MFDARCGACDETLQHAVWSPWPGFRRRLKRVVRAALVTLLVCGVPAAIYVQRVSRRAEVRPWKLGAQIDALASGDPPDWQQVRVLARQLVDMRPESERGWYMLALSGRRLGYHPRLAVREAREALRHAPEMGEAHLLAAAELAGLGEYEAARAHAGHAIAWSMAPAETWRLAGELELTRVRPDVETALAYFEEARRRGLVSTDLDVRAALLRQRLVGVIAPERYPPELTVALRRARQALERAESDDAPAGLRDWFAAELELAEGHRRTARRHIEDGLRTTAEPGSDPIVRGRLLTTLGRLELAERHDEQAVDAFREAVATSGTSETVGTVLRILTASGKRDLASSVLSFVAVEDDPDGVVRAALADDEWRSGRLDEALRLARESVAVAPRSVERRLLLGDVLVARAAFDEAQAEYERAAASEGDTLAARIRLAMLPIAQSGEDRVAAAETAIAVLDDLRGSASDHTTLDAALGKALVAAGRADEATVAYERVVRALPWSATAWLELAEAWRLSSVVDATERSSDCAAEAARIRPFDRDVVVAVARAAARNADDAGAVVATSVYLERAPDDAGVLRQRAEARLRLGDWAGAIDDLKLARAQGDDDLVVRLQLADAYVRAGRDEEAWALVATADVATDRRALEVVLATHVTRDPPAGVGLASPVAIAVRHARDGDPVSALAVLRAAHGSRHDDVLVARALVLLLCGPEDLGLPLDARLREAREVLDALGVAAGSGLTSLLRGRILLASGDAAAAIEPLRAAAEALPWDPGAHYLLGEALFAEGMSDAREPYARALWLPGGRNVYGPAIAVRFVELSDRADDASLRERSLREALRADPTLSVAATRLCDALLARGAGREAAQVAERGVAAFRKDREDAAEVEIALRKRALAARLEIGDAEAAGRQLDALERIGGSVARADTVRGLVALARRRPADAVRLFRVALEADDDDRLAAIGLAEALVRSEDVDGALAFTRARIESHPDELPLARVVTRSLVRVGRTDSALAVAQEMVARAPTDVDAIRQRAWVLGLLGRADEARASAQDAARAARALDDPSQRVRAGLFDVLGAECLLQLAGRAEEALSAVRAVVAEPAVSGAARRAARVVEAECLVELGRTDEAEAVVRALTAGWIDDRPEVADDVRVEPRVRFVLGMIAFQRGRTTEAAEEFVTAVRLDPVHHAAANNAAWCIAQTDAASPAALDLARRATAASPAAATYWDTRATCERGAGLWDEAVTSWRRADQLLAEASARSGDRARILLTLAELFVDLGRSDEARDTARLVMSLAPDSAYARRAAAIAEGR